MLYINMLRKSSLKLSPFVQILSRSCSKDANSDITWSTGEKEHPVSWRHNPKYWYHKKDLSIIYPHKLDPKDPAQKYPHKTRDGGIQYFNFVHYPRHPEEAEVDPPIKPTPLLFVFRTKRLKYRPYWEKRIIEQLGLGGYKSGRATVCKNIPEVNALLWQVKHLVTILPFKVPENMPKDANPLHCFVHENGEVVYNPSVKVTEKHLELPTEENSITKEWVNEQARKKYHDSLDLKF